MTPFTVLHVCLGNICRSPMAERLLPVAVAEAAGSADPDRAGELVRSASAGTGDWHLGEPMHRSSARQVRRRGGDPAGFRARQLTPGMVDEADLVLVATGVHRRVVVGMRPAAAGRTFLLGELARLLPLVDTAALPPGKAEPGAVRERGAALVAALDTVRAGARPRPGDELEDPYGAGERTFARVADEIEAALRPLAAVLTA